MKKIITVLAVVFTAGTAQAQMYDTWHRNNMGGYSNYRTGTMVYPNNAGGYTTFTPPNRQYKAVDPRTYEFEQRSRRTMEIRHNRPEYYNGTGRPSLY